jgi:ribonuclease III
MTREREVELARLADVLGHRFSDQGLLDRALTHTSWANELLAEPLAATASDHAGEPPLGEGPVSRPAVHNEPLEFLGDAVLGFLVADLLHARDPGGSEGVKTKARAHLVASASLARRAARLGLPALLQLGRGEEKTGGRHKHALWADAYEALIAALYLDGGLEAARRFVTAEFAPELDAAVSTLADHDAKSALQELLQGRGQLPPDYVVAAEEGPSHRRRFRVRCEVGGVALGEGEGSSKKQAQQEAAQRALRALRGL